MTKTPVYVWMSDLEFRDIEPESPEDGQKNAALILQQGIPAAQIDEILFELGRRINFRAGDEGQVRPEWLSVQFWSIVDKIVEGDFIPTPDVNK